MPLAKSHPCNTFSGWLFVESSDAQAAMTEQLRLRDQEQAKDRLSSGEPPGFREWSINQVRNLASNPRIANQIQQRCAVLQDQLARLEKEAARKLAELQANTETIEDELAMLESLTKGAA